MNFSAEQSSDLRTPEVQFQTMTDLTRAAEVLEMMEALYREDQADFPADPAKFPMTLRRFIEHPGSGRVILFLRAELLCGYALLVPYWSNEFGGTLLYVDELFVQPAVRNLGIGKSFFAFLRRVRPFEAVAAGLETSPTNHRARRFYESLGFRPRANSTLIHYWSESAAQDFARRICL